jgi:hypothetical protein
MKTCFALALAALLAGCVTAADQLSAAQDRTCQQWGFKPGTPGYGNCQLELSRQAANAAAVDEAAYVATAWWNRPLPRQPQTCTYGGTTLGGINGGTMTCW